MCRDSKNLLAQDLKFFIGNYITIIRASVTKRNSKKWKSEVTKITGETISEYLRTKSIWKKKLFDIATI